MQPEVPNGTAAMACSAVGGAVRCTEADGLDQALVEQLPRRFATREVHGTVEVSGSGALLDRASKLVFSQRQPNNAKLGPRP